MNVDTFIAELVLSHKWCVTTAHDQASLDRHMPILLTHEAKGRVVHLDGLRGPVDLGLQSATCACCPRWASRWVRLHRPIGPDMPQLRSKPDHVADAGIYRASGNKHGALTVPTPAGALGIKPNEFDCLPAVDWVVVGGGDEPMHPDWVRSLRDQCVVAGVPFYFKGWGAWAPWRGPSARTPVFAHRNGTVSEEQVDGMSISMHRVGEKISGRMLDARVWSDMPQIWGGT